MYGLPKTVVVVHLRGGHFCDSLDFFSIGLYAFFAKDGAVEGNLAGFYLTFFVFECEIVVTCYLHYIE